ncbi:MAG: efflux RND transporter permease subunit [Myxococcota bacterium]
MSQAPVHTEAQGPLAWMASNTVAANLLMATLLIGGISIGLRTKQEVFPEFDLDTVVINVAYPGASPAEVEQGVVLAVEEAVRSLDGVKEIRSTAGEGSGVVVVELLLGIDNNKALADIKSAVDRITSFPQDIERPIVSLASTRSQVISLVVYGDQPESVLRELAVQARDTLLQDKRITIAELAAVRPLEMSIEVPQEKLRAYNLTLEDVAAAIRRASIEIPGGGVKTQGGELLVRTTERRDSADDFARVEIKSLADGSRIRVGDIATVNDGFADTDFQALFDGKPAAMVQVYRVGEQTPIDVAAATHEYLATAQAALPPGIKLAVWGDSSEMYSDRVDLLVRNGYFGLALVLLTLGLFLEARLAFWVTMGIPISFIGAFFFMKGLDVSINMISLFAFIITLGIVVDDAIVVGEAIYHRRGPKVSFLQAAIGGVREVAVPVTFSVLTTVIAFTPLLFIPGTSGKFFRNIPLVVISVLLLSLLESLLVLPAHLSHAPSTKGFLGMLNRLFVEPILDPINRGQQRFSRGFQRFVRERYKPMIEKAVRQRYLTIAACSSLLLASLGLVMGERINFTFMPRIDSDRVTAQLAMPFGTPIEQTRVVSKRLIDAANGVLEEVGGAASVSRGVLRRSVDLDRAMAHRGGAVAAVVVTWPRLRFIWCHRTIETLQHRSLPACGAKRSARSRALRRSTIDLAPAPAVLAEINIELSHKNLDVLEQAAKEVAAQLHNYAGVTDIYDGFSDGKDSSIFV